MPPLLRLLAALALLMAAALHAPLSPALAQTRRDPQPTFSPAATLRFRHLSTDAGLPSSRVDAIVKDARGFLWFGTAEGLARYDGYEFLAFKHEPANTNSLSSNRVTALHEDADGALWIGTSDGGLNRLDPARQAFTRYRPQPEASPDSIGGPTVQAIDVGASGTLWLATMGARGPLLEALDPATQTFQHFPLACNGRSSGGVRRVLADEAAGAVWVVVDDLLRFDLRTHEVTCYQPRPSPGAFDPRTIVRLADVALGDDGLLWLAGSDALYTFNPQTAAFTAYRPAASDAGSPFRLNTLHLDGQGLVWVGSGVEDGIAVFDQHTRAFVARYANDLSNPDSPSAAMTVAMAGDNEGLLWIATSGAGVDVLDRRQLQFRHYRGDPLNGKRFPKAGIQAMHEDADGALWIGSSTELARFNPADGSLRQFQVFAGPLPLATPAARLTASLVPDERGGLWFDGIDGLYRFDTRTQKLRAFRNVPIEKGEPLNIWQIAPDERGGLWVLAGHTLSRFDRARERFAERFSLRQPGPPRAATTLAVDRAGAVWAGGDSFLSRIDPRTGEITWFTHSPREPDGMPKGEVRGISPDRTGNLWLATSAGLVKFAPGAGAFTRYDQHNGLPTDELVGLLHDQQGRLWVSSAKGLARFDPVTREVLHFERSDGLQGNQFNQFAAYQSPRGELFFGGPGGLTAFFPQRIRTNPYRPPLALTGIELFNRPGAADARSPLRTPIWEAEALTLRDDQQIFSLKFAALSYAAPERNHYRYRLEGFEEDWHEVESGRRFATYTSLPPGEYRLRVQGSNNSGVWSDREIDLRLTVLPPWWATWWFRLAAAASGGAAAVLWWRWRVRSLRQRNEQLARQVAERTAELAQAKEQAEAARRQVEAVNLHLQRLAVLDELTQVANRRRFDQYLHEQWAKPQRPALSLLLCDIDAFKRYNDLYGHQAGDRCLHLVAQALGRAAGRAAGLVARYGGEEFAVILPNTSASGALGVARAIQEQLRGLRLPHAASGVAEHVTMSIGVACADAAGNTSPTQLIAAADAALYHAKRQGRNRVVAGRGAQPAAELTSTERSA